MSLQDLVEFLCCHGQAAKKRMKICLTSEEGMDRAMRIILSLIGSRIGEMGQARNGLLHDYLWDHAVNRFPAYLEEKGPEVIELVFKAYWRKTIRNKSIDYTRRAGWDWRGADRIDLDGPISDNDSTSIAEKFSDPLQRDFRDEIDTPKYRYLIELIEQALEKVDQRVAEMYRAHYFEGLNKSEIGRRHGKNPKQMTIVLNRVARGVHQVVFDLLLNGPEIHQMGLCKALNNLTLRLRQIIIWRCYDNLSLRILGEIFEGSKDRKDAADTLLHEAFQQLLHQFLSTD